MLTKDYQIEPIKYSQRDIEILWDHFEDVAIDPETEKLDEDFFIWKKGTDKEDIWHWFDERYRKGIYYLLYEYDSKNENWKEYQTFKLKWMVSSGYTMEDLMNKMAEIMQEELTIEGNPHVLLDEALEILENETGFAGNEIWPCYSEWLNEEKVLEDEETIGFLKELFESEQQVKNGFEKEMEL